MRVLLVLMFLLAIGCSTPTQYVPDKNNLGYSDEIVSNDLRKSTFKGNSATKKETAELYAKLRAIEICQELGKTYTHILVVKDKTFSKEVTQTSSASPNYYYGMSPYYGRYGAYGAPWGVSYGAPVNTSTESKTYPLFDVYFECVEKPLDARVALINLSSSQMQGLTKDLQGAVQVDEVLPDSPNKGKIQKGDIIIKANGDRVTTVLEVYQASRKANQNNLKVELFRNGVRKEAIVKFADVSELVAHAQAEILKEACSNKDIKAQKSVCK